LRLRVVRLVAKLPKNDVGRVIGKQLLRSGTSIGANYREATRASTKKHFTAIMVTALREADETLYWLELLAESNTVKQELLNDLANECRELVAILAASVKKAAALHTPHVAFTFTSSFLHLTSYFMTTRRTFIKEVAMTAAGLALPTFWSVRGAFAEALAPTPRQTEGPFYPDRLPLDTDNDLIIVNDSITPAVGEITHLSGKVLDSSGNPLHDALVEIWQVDGNGVYLHSASRHAQRDANFQGFGRFLTGTSGEYYFRTVKPVPYPGRTPHIHFKIKRLGADEFTTQCYIKGFPQNERDGIYRRIRDPKARESVSVDFKPIKESKAGELAARFDIVLGMTPQAN
jgi:protocatechuate 3,4-dioxygenase, beta subunit